VNSAADIQALADIAVSAGTATPQEAQAWVAADLAEIGAQPTLGTPGAAAAPGDAGIHARAAELVRTGAMTREQADRALAAYLAAPLPEGSTAPAEAAAAPPAGPPADPLGSLTVDPVFDRPASPNAYQLPFSQAVDLTTDQMRQVQQLCFQARLPQALAVDLFTTADRYQAAPLSEEAHKLQAARTRVLLERQFGDQLPTKLAQADKLLAMVEKANPLMTALLESGLNSDPRFCLQVIQHAERLLGARELP
jgi:hypothetical protein